MTDSTDRFGDIRSLVHEQPSAERWAALCQLLTDWPMEDLTHRVLPYLDAHLKHWPNTLKVSPRSWIARINRSVTPNAFSIVKHVHATRHQPTHTLLMELSHRTEALEHLEMLTLIDNLIDDDLTALSDWPALPKLQHLTMDNHSLTNRGVHLLCEAFADSPRLQSLSLQHNRINAGGLEDLISTLPQWIELQTLHLQGNRVTSTTGRQLAHWTPSHTIKHLGIGRPHGDQENATGLGAHGMASLLEATWTHQLHTLDLSGNGLEDDAMDIFAVYLTNAEQLHTLKLSRNPLGPLTLAQLSPHLTSVTYLDLGMTQVGDQGMHALGALTNLRHLALYNSQLGEAGVRTLLHKEDLPNLHVLDLSHNYLTPQTMTHLDTSTLNQLKHLNLGVNALGDDGMYYISRAHNLQVLHTLKLHHNTIGERGCRALATSHTLPNLLHLDLSSNPLGSRGAHALTEHEGLQNLQALKLNSCDLDDDAAIALANCPHLGTLQTLELRNNNITSRGYRHLSQSEHLPLHLRILAANQAGEPLNPTQVP